MSTQHNTANNYAQLTAKQRKEMRTEAIRKEYHQLDAVRENGAKKYTSEWIFTKIAKRYFLAPGTIEHIVYGRCGY